MKFCCLGSGSKGNSTLVSYESTLLMIDCGFSMRQTVESMRKKNCNPEQLSAILVTHEHTDHIKGVSALARKYQIPVYATRGTAKTGKLETVEHLHWITPDRSFQLDDVTITPVTVPHDAYEPCQFLFEANDKKLGIVTDLGSVSAHVQTAFHHCDALLLEANHDLNMLWQGPYAASLKRRVASDWGHLNNQQAEDFVHTLNLAKLKSLVLGHISEQNNSVEKVRQHFRQFEQSDRQVLYACQEEGFDWLYVEK